MTQSSILATAATFDIEDRHMVSRSDWRHGILLTDPRNGDIDNRTRRRFLLKWSPGTTAQAVIVREHYAANGHVAFDLDLPGGETAKAIYREPPDIQHRTPAAAEIAVVLEEALITD